MEDMAIEKSVFSRKVEEASRAIDALTNDVRPEAIKRALRAVLDVQVTIIEAIVAADEK